MSQMKTVFRVRAKEVLGPVKASPKQGNSEYDKPTFHTRRTHTKSRTGCTQCKKRRTKCDERRPMCRKCDDSASICEYVATSVGSKERTVDKLGPPTRNTDGTDFPSMFEYDMSLALTAASLDALLQSAGDLPTHRGSSMTSYVHILQHFETVTYATTGNLIVHDVVKACNLKFAMTYPYLMHATLAFATAHLKHLLPASANPTEYRQNSLTESYHWQRASHLFRKELNSPLGLGRHNMDPVLTAAMLLGRQSFLLDAGESESRKRFVNAAPEKTPAALQWFTVQAGLKSLLAEFMPHIPKSIWFPVLSSSDDNRGSFFDQRPGAEGLPPALAEICNIEESSTMMNNPYHAPLRLLTPMLHIEAGTATFIKLVTFMGRMDPRFHGLLMERDPAALLLFSYWLALMSQVDQWWIVGRTRHECVAICHHLRRQPEPRIWPLLDFPESLCGIGLKKDAEGNAQFDGPWAYQRGMNSPST